MSLRLLMHERHLRVEPITTDRQRSRTGMLTARHRHPVFHLMYVTEGEGRFLVNDRITLALPGLLYIINPNEWHQFHGNEARPLHNVECTFVLRNDQDEPADANFFDWFEERRGIPVPPRLRQEPIAVPAKFRPFLLEGFNRLLDPGNRYVSNEHKALMVTDLMLRAEELLWHLTADADTVPEGTAREVAELQRYMAANMGETLRLEQLAMLVHWTPNYLCRVFKAHAGMTPMAYLQQLRMAEAEKLLLYTDRSVSDVADMLGYEDPSYFARVFRRHFDRAPSDYRRG